MVRNLLQYPITNQELLDVLERCRKLLEIEEGNSIGGASLIALDTVIARVADQDRYLRHRVKLTESVSVTGADGVTRSYGPGWLLITEDEYIRLRDENIRLNVELQDDPTRVPAP